MVVLAMEVLGCKVLAGSPIVVPAHQVVGARSVLGSIGQATTCNELHMPVSM